MHVCFKGLLAFHYVLFCFPTFSLGSEATTQEQRQVARGVEDDLDGTLIRFIRIPDKSLPTGVRLVSSIRSAPILVPIERNPQVFTEKEHIHAVARFFGIDGDRQLEKIDSAVVALYQEHNPANEIGVFGIHFRDERAADRNYKQLIKLQTSMHRENAIGK